MEEGKATGRVVGGMHRRGWGGESHPAGQASQWSECPTAAGDRNGCGSRVPEAGSTMNGEQSGRGWSRSQAAAHAARSAATSARHDHAAGDQGGDRQPRGY